MDSKAEVPIYKPTTEDMELVTTRAKAMVDRYPFESREGIMCKVALELACELRETKGDLEPAIKFMQIIRRYIVTPDSETQALIDRLRRRS